MRRIVTGSAALLASVLSLTGIVAIASPAAAAVTDLKINEVESNGGTPVDWVELYNPTGADIDAAGLRLKDSDDSRTFAIPASSIVPAGGYLAVDVDVTGGFGLGAADSIRLFQSDGTTLVDSYEWTTHAATTYGTCVPGSDAFYVTTASTKGAANDCTVDPTAVLVLNEIESNPNPDWIELKNSGTVPVDASGIVVKDNSESDPYTIPSGTIVEPGAYLTLDALGGLGLGGADSVRLFASSSATEPFHSYTWTAHAAQTYGRCADGIGPIGDTAAPTKGAANSCGLPAETANIKINEVQSDPDDIIELVNTGATDVDVADWYLKDSQTLNPITGADPLIVPAGGFLRLDGEDVNFDFGLGKGDSVHLIWSDGVTELDSTMWAADTHVTSWGRCPDGTGAFQVLGTATFGAANACAADYSKLAINEIESNGDTTDWVELMNTGSVPLDATGLILKDSTEGNNITIPSSAPIAAGGFLAVDVTGLGGGDTVRLFNGATLLTSYAYPTHADETWGRCPDGVGDFADTDAPTKGAANDCAAPVGYQNIKVNEVESSGGTPVDWIEFYNTGDTAVDLSLWVVKDNDDSHSVKFPASTTIAAHGFITIDTDVTGGFGLGNEDSARLFLPDGTTLVDSQSWGPAHATVTFGLCPDGTGSLKQTFTSTKGGPNDCSPIRINEVESNGGTPGDWVELINAGTAPVDITGYVLKDSDDTHSIAVPATTLAVGQLVTVDVDVDGGFGLGGSDSIRLLDGAALLDSYTWTAHAATTYGRCPNGTGAFAVTEISTKGTANECTGTVTAEAWPGPAPVSTVDTSGFFGEDMSGLAYEGTGTATRGTLWAVNNGTGVLFKLTWDGTKWVTPAGEWAAGKALRYPDGAGQPDSEGVGFGGQTSADGVYVATERNDVTSGSSRPSVLRYDVSGAGTSLTATNEWNLTGLIPPVGNNTGLEGISWVPDSFLTGQGFLDESTGQAYDPADYANHGGGLFFIGVEATAGVYAFALSSDNTAHLVATLATGLTVAAEVTFEPTTGELWAACDDACQGRIAVFEIAQDGPFDGKFRIAHVYDNPVGMTDTIANEGFAFGDQGLCVDATKPVWYADDNGTGGFALREAAIDCVSDVVPTDPVPPTEEQLTPDSKNLVTGPASAKPGDTITITVGDEFSGAEFSAWIFSDPVLMGTQAVTGAGTLSATIPLSTPAGAHRIAVTDAEGNLIGWFDIAITATGLPVTGAELGPVLPIALLVLLAGGLLLFAARSRWLRSAA